jgi:ATP/maltotriose-dependent transcriptional regulator MalT
LEPAVAGARGALRGRLLLGLATMEGIGGQHDAALEHYAEARGELQDDDSRSARFEADVRAAMVLFDGDRFDEAMQRLAPAIAAADELGDDWVSGLALNVRGWLVSARGDQGEAEAAFAKSRDALLRAGDQMTALHPRINLASLLINAGELERAEAELADASREAAKTGESVVWASIAELTAQVLWKQGRTDAALQAAADAERYANVAGDTYYAEIARALIADIRRESDHATPT